MPKTKVKTHKRRTKGGVTKVRQHQRQIKGKKKRLTSSRVLDLIKTTRTVRTSNYSEEDKEYYDLIAIENLLTEQLSTPKSEKLTLQEIRNAMDVLDNVEEIEDMLYNITEEERDDLYNHPILEEYDLLP